MEGVDEEVLISLVEAKPVIWDKTLEIYKDRNSTKKAWEEVCLALNPDLENNGDGEKNAFGNIVTLKANINMCGMSIEWNHLTRRQRKGLRLLYRHGCTCKIRKCSLGKRCYRQRDSCIWRNSCETKEGICLRQPNKSCMWARTRALTTCSREWRRNVTMSSSYHQYNNFAFHH
ncbi:unnamed protein product [Diabrotica balteata]|uniref:MADF domain-containing protein n=1 Tax=Diabrotica balteata TaxID=107213 RepID=A0A9N9STV0_DIABA|nr:unnamed protein product [Diabrotica balteata]